MQRHTTNVLFIVIVLLSITTNNFVFGGEDSQAPVPTNIPTLHNEHEKITLTDTISTNLSKSVVLTDSLGIHDNSVKNKYLHVTLEDSVTVASTFFQT